MKSTTATCLLTAEVSTTKDDDLFRRSMALDEDVYAEPTTFNPERFLPKSEGGNAEPHLSAAFGFDRRICPGKHLAAASIWIVVAMIFATTGITSRPKRFRCATPPRSDIAARLVTSNVDAL
ncbi:cytochrome P450 family protein [Pleurotus pulmonarius]